MRFIGKLLERTMWFFPMFHIISILGQIYCAFKRPSGMNFAILIFIIYFLPPLLYRIFSLIVPVKVGKVKLGPEHEPNGWMIAHRLQMTYHIFPFIEGTMNSLPGIYSNWLRLWGSKIGRMVYWAPDVRIYDRTHLTVGSKTFVGGALLSCHLAVPKRDGSFELFFAPISIGNRVFISAQANIGPGSNIHDGEHIKLLTQTFGDKRKALL
jgi:hypothetical protein